MAALDMKEVTQYVENNIGAFHKRKLENLNTLSLTKVLLRKNPYLFKVKALTNAGDIVKALVDAHLSSNEETLFGDWMEGLAVFINNRVYGGIKGGTGIDLDFTKDGVRYIVAIKSGPNWANSEQTRRMRETFSRVMKAIRSSQSGVHVVAVNGCCYGRDNRDRGDHYKWCGQKFWTFISGDENLYTEIVEPLGHKAKVNLDAFNEAYGRVLTQFTAEFISLFCKTDFSIDWDKLTKHNSSADKKDIVRMPKAPKVKKETEETELKRLSKAANISFKAKPKKVVKGAAKKAVKKAPMKRSKKR